MIAAWRGPLGCVGVLSPQMSHLGRLWPHIWGETTVQLMLQQHLEIRTELQSSGMTALQVESALSHGSGLNTRFSQSRHRL